MYDFMTNNLGFRRMELNEIKNLVPGDMIAIGLYHDKYRMEFIDAVVVSPLFYNSDADVPDWEIETDNGFVDAYSVYEVTELY